MAEGTKWRGEDVLHRGGISLLGKQECPSIVDNMFFFQMGTSSSQVLEGSPLTTFAKRL
jgi:hypothetical protein